MTACSLALTECLVYCWYRFAQIKEWCVSRSGADVPVIPFSATFEKKVAPVSSLGSRCAMARAISRWVGMVRLWTIVLSMVLQYQEAKGPEEKKALLGKSKATSMLPKIILAGYQVRPCDLAK